MKSLNNKGGGEGKLTTYKEIKFSFCQENYLDSVKKYVFERQWHVLELVPINLKLRNIDILNVISREIIEYVHCVDVIIGFIWVVNFIL